jgi:hypothetical protein
MQVFAGTCTLPLNAKSGQSMGNPKNRSKSVRQLFPGRFTLCRKGTVEGTGHSSRRAKGDVTEGIEFFVADRSSISGRVTLSLIGSAHDVVLPR